MLLPGPTRRSSTEIIADRFFHGCTVIPEYDRLIINAFSGDGYVWERNKKKVEIPSS